jgi:hypothetical protein
MIEGLDICPAPCFLCSFLIREDCVIFPLKFIAKGGKKTCHFGQRGAVFLRKVRGAGILTQALCNIITNNMFGDADPT